MGYRNLHEYITIPKADSPAVDVEGAVLVGGASRRMGRDKALLPWNGRPLALALAETLRPLVRRVRLIGRNPTPGHPFGDLELVPDLRPGNGPLSGIHAALATAGADSVLVVACDLPFVHERFLRGLLESLTPELQAVVPFPGGIPVPVCALYHRSCLPIVEERLDRGELAAGDFARSLRVRLLGDEEIARLDPSGRCLWNLNTPADYAQASELPRERK